MYAYSCLFVDFRILFYWLFSILLIPHISSFQHNASNHLRKISSFHFFLNLKTPTEEKPAERTLADVLEEDDEFEEFEQEHWGKAQEEEGDAKQWQDNWGRFFINLKLQKLADTCIKQLTFIYLFSLHSILFYFAFLQKILHPYSLYLIHCVLPWYTINYDYFKIWNDVLNFSKLIQMMTVERTNLLQHWENNYLLKYI